MKVFNLQCSAQHAFEGWFGSEQDYASQQARGLLECPVCADKAVQKLPSAPRLNFGAAAPAEPTTPAPAPGPAAQTQAQSSVTASPEAVALQAAWLQAARRIVEQTEDVGERFAEEARKIHYGEVEERGIRGQTTPEQRQELLEEGISVMQLPLPAGLKGPLQ